MKCFLSAYGIRTYQEKDKICKENISYKCEKLGSPICVLMGNGKILLEHIDGMFIPWYTIHLIHLLSLHFWYFFAFLFLVPFHFDNLKVVLQYSIKLDQIRLTTVLYMWSYIVCEKKSKHIKKARIINGLDGLAIIRSNNVLPLL